MAKDKTVQVKAIAVGTVMYKGRTLAHRWPTHQARIMALLCHQGYISDTQMRSINPKTATIKLWHTWLTGAGSKSAKPEQRPTGDILLQEKFGEMCVVLKNGPSPLPWLEDDLDFEEALSLAPSSKRQAGGAVKPKRVKAVAKPKAAVAVVEDEDEDEEDIEEEEEEELD